METLLTEQFSSGVLLKSIEWYIIPCQVSYELGSKQLIPISRYDPNIFLEEHESIST
jgi:hypothetical protein